LGSVSKNDRRQKVVEITTRLVSEISPMVQGVYFIPLGWSDVVERVIENIKPIGSELVRASGVVIFKHVAS